MEFEIDLRSKVPAQSTTNNPRSESIVPCLLIAEHDTKILGYVVQKNLEGMRGFELCLCTQNGVQSNGDTARTKTVDSFPSALCMPTPILEALVKRSPRALKRDLVAA
jgi:hypothetical protein